jgi:hypothetical protein
MHVHTHTCCNHRPAAHVPPKNCAYAVISWSNTSNACWNSTSLETTSATRKATAATGGYVCNIMVNLIMVLIKSSTSAVTRQRRYRTWLFCKSGLIFTYAYANKSRNGFYQKRLERGCYCGHWLGHRFFGIENKHTRNRNHNRNYNRNRNRNRNRNDD